MNNISDENLYQDFTTRTSNDLIYRMKELFKEKKLTNDEYAEFISMVRCYAEIHHLYFDREQEMLYKIKN